jgi:hypothetical protein
MSSSPSPRGGAAALPIALRPLIGAALCVALLAVVGCGKKSGPERVAVVPVEGAITFTGQPMPGAMVVFHPKTPQPNVPAPRAEINKDGVLKVSTYDGGDGAPEGEYVVTVQWNKLVKQGSDLVIGPNVVPAKFAAEGTSTLTAVIKAPGPNKIELKL